jgi:hypothetical protein
MAGLHPLVARLVDVCSRFGAPETSTVRKTIARDPDTHQITEILEESERLAVPDRRVIAAEGIATMAKIREAGATLSEDDHIAANAAVLDFADAVDPYVVDQESRENLEEGRAIARAYLEAHGAVVDPR